MEQTNKLISKIANKDINKIYIFQFLIRAILYCIASIIIIFFFEETYRTGYSNITLVLTILLWLVVLGVVIIHNIFIKVVDDILVNQIDLKKYVDYYEYTYKKSSGYNKSQAKNAIQFSKGIKYFYEGNFQQALNYFNSYNIKKVSIPDRKRMIIVLAVYKQWSLIHLGNFENEENLLNDIPEIKNTKLRLRVDGYKEVLISITNILKGKTDSYFEDISSENRLNVISNNYYQARACQNANEFDKAKELFQKIANENPELFYVQEAKQYLEEN